MIFSEHIIRLELMRRMHEIAVCCSERLGRFQSSVYIWLLPVIVKLVCDHNSEVNSISIMMFVWRKRRKISRTVPYYIEYSAAGMAQSLSSRALDLQLLGCGFNSHRDKAAQ